MLGRPTVALFVVAVVMLPGGRGHGSPSLRSAMGPWASPCTRAPVGSAICAKGRLVACPLQLWLGCTRLFGAPRLLAMTPSRPAALHADRRLRKLLGRTMHPLTGSPVASLLRLAGFRHELDLGVSLQSQRFTNSLVNTYDRNQATHGQFVVTYRRALFPHSPNWLEQRMALVVYAYKIGVDTPLLRQLFTGGWLAMEWSLFPYRRRLPGRILVRVASLGGHTELARDNLSGKRRLVFFLNAALSVEGSYRLGPVTAVFTSTAMPRYEEQRFGTRVESSFALRVQLFRHAVARAWISEITLEPKVTHYYHSYPLIEEIRSRALTEELQQRVRTYGWSDLRHILTVYCNIRFRLRL